MGRSTKISVAQRFKPFSHEAGASAIIPYTDWVVTAYPTRFEISDFFCDTILIELEISGPVNGFTLQQDLEKGECLIFGTAQEGYFEFRLFVEKKQQSLVLEYSRGKGIVVFVDGKKIALSAKEALDLIDVKFDSKMFEDRERISLGDHKKQDVTSIWKRKDLAEILPILYFTSQSVLLSSDEKFTKYPKDDESFLNFIDTGFCSIFVPQRKDEKHLGLTYEKLSESSTPISRLEAFQKSFRSLFIREVKGKVVLLPNLPKCFSSGRFVGAKVQDATIDFEWRKGKLRCVVIHGRKDANILIDWPKEIMSFRIDDRKGSQKKQQSLTLLKGKKTVVDKFQR